MNITWKSILSAVLSGAVLGAAQYQQSGGTSLKGTGIVAGAGALVGLTNYLLQSPLLRPKAISEPSPEPPKAESAPQGQAAA